MLIPGQSRQNPSENVGFQPVLNPQMQGGALPAEAGKKPAFVYCSTCVIAGLGDSVHCHPGGLLREPMGGILWFSGTPYGLLACSHSLSLHSSDEVPISRATRKPRAKTLSPLGRDRMAYVPGHVLTQTPSHCPIPVLVHLLFKNPTVVCVYFFQWDLKRPFWGGKAENKTKQNKIKTPSNNI